MNTKEIKDVILRDVIKHELKTAGYKAARSFYYAKHAYCCLAISIASSRFNSAAIGFSFGLEIFLLPEDVAIKTVKLNRVDYPMISEYLLLPDCGFNHPYRKGLEYYIGGNGMGQPQIVNITGIMNRIGVDMREHILPQLAEVNSPFDWELKCREWEKVWTSSRVEKLRNSFLAR